MNHRPLFTRTPVEASLNPVLGKSVVMYFEKGEGSMSGLFLSKGLFLQEFLGRLWIFYCVLNRPTAASRGLTAVTATLWDHVESAMGLSIGGEYSAAENAYRWLKNAQLEDGSWWAAYRAGQVDNRRAP